MTMPEMSLNAPAAEPSKQTLASSAYDRLRQAIIAGALAPGERLRIRTLCDQFAMGLSPVREALSRLSSEGLVTQQDHRGFAVTPLSMEGLDGLLRARLWLNEIGLRESIRHGDAAWEEHAILTMHRLSRTNRHLDGDKAVRNPAWETAHQAFHAALLAGCRSDWLTGFCAQLFEASERYRHIARLAGRQRPANEQEHRAILDATVARDANLAVRLLSEHFERTGELVRKVLQERTAPTR